MKNNFQSKAVPRGTRTIWRYLGALFILFTFAIGNVWGAQNVTFGTAIGTKGYVYSSSSVADNTILTDKCVYYSSAKNTVSLSSSKIIAYRLSLIFELSSSAKVDAVIGSNKNKPVTYVLYALTSTQYDFIKSMSGVSNDVANAYVALDESHPMKTLFKDASITANDGSRQKLLSAVDVADVTTKLYTSDSYATSTSATTTIPIWKSATGDSKDVLAAGYYAIYIDCGSSSGNTLDNLTFTAVPSCTNVAAPTGLSCTAHTENSLTYGWTAAEHASKYEVKLWNNSTCTGDPVASDANVTTTSKTFTGLDASSTYYCKVQSKGDGTTYCAEGGVTDAVSGDTDASTCTDVAAPTSLAENTAVRTIEKLTFTWTAATNVSSYTATLYSDAECSAEVESKGSLTETSVYFDGLTDETTYYCKVQSHGDGTTYCANGGITDAVSGTTATIPSYNVTVATSTGDDTRGTVSAAAASVKEGSTTTITAVPAPGYRVANWAVSGEGASISPSGSSNSKTTTLTMGSADATVTVTFEVIPCPTSGVLYTMTMKSKSLSGVTQNTEVALVVGDYATEEGGVSYLGNNNSDASKAQIKTEAGGIVYFNGNDAYLKVALDCPLQPGDLITIEGNASSTELKYLITNTNSRSSYVTSTNTTGTKKYYTVVADDILDGKSNVYFWREGSSGNKNIHSITITRPYNVTFVSDHGTAPTTPTKALSFTLTELSDASFTHTGWTADKLVKVGGETKAAGTALAVDATVELTDNTTFTATWEAKAATFAVTYKANNGTEEADINDPAASTFAANTFTVPDGKMFAGWNTKADGEGTNYTVGDAVTADITVYAKWVVDPTIRLILKAAETYSINTENFLVYAGTVLQNEAYTVDGRTFAKNFKLANTGSSIAGQTWANKYFAYDVASNSTDIKLYLYNKNSSAQNLYYQVIPEGTAAGSMQTVSVASKGEGQVVSIPTIAAAKGARIVFCVQSTDIRFCQVEVLENGTALPAFGTNGYEFSVPGRAATYSKVGTFDGFEFKTNAELKFISGQDYIALRNIDGSQYVKFTVATNIQLQVTTPNANKFYVSKTAAGDAEKDTQYGGSAATHNVNLHAGTYYIAPAAGSSDGEVRITKLAFVTAPEVKTVNFNSNGGSSVEAQEVFAGEKAVKPEDPTKDGYRFVEWQLSGSAYDFDDAVATDITLDAIWQKTWKVTFNANNGSDPVVVVVDNNQAVAQPTDPEKAGFDFVEWQLSGSAYDFATLVTGDITLTATWEVAQDDASLSALSYDGNAIDVASAEEVSGVQTYTYHLPWGSSINAALISVTKNAESATMSSITYNSEDKQATFQVTSGNGSVSINYAIQFVIDAKRGTSIVKAVVSGGDQKAGFAATGIYGDKGYAYTRNNKKLDTADKFVGVKLISGKTFATGDKLFVVTSTDADMGYIEIYEEAEGTNLIKATGVRDASEGIVVPELEGYSEFYIVRKASTGDQAWNGFVDYVEVTREMDPAIKSFKFGEDAATINEAAKTISIEVPYGTNVTALTPTVEAYGNNGATYTPAGETDFTSPVDYVVTDAYSELSTTYAVTVNIAAPSENANLASLAVAGYPFDFDPATTSYNVVLDYGTTELPAITYEVEEVGLATAVKAEGGVNGATTITVTPQAGESYNKVYKINFSVSTTPKFVIFDGSTMTDYAESGSDLGTGFAWAVVGGNHSEKSADVTLNGKTYAKGQNIFTSPTASNTRYIEITIPEGYLAKFYLAGATNSKDETRSSFISKEITSTLDESIAYVSTDQYAGAFMQSDFQFPGTYYYCATKSIRLYELSIQLYPIDYSRAINAGRYGTICLPNGGVIAGATIFEIAYMDYQDSKPYKIYFDEVLNGEMVAGMPYIFLPKEGASQLAVTYTDAADAAAGNYRGLYGSYSKIKLEANAGIYILKNNQYWFVDTDNVYCDVNKAYIKLAEVPDFDPGKPAYGRRRVALGVNSENAAQGFENIENGDAPVKVMIDGTLYILRGEKVYDATGRLIK